MSVPEVLLSGDHGKIARWRLEQRRLRTEQRRPDLWQAYAATNAALLEAERTKAERKKNRKRKPGAGEAEPREDQ
jgi:tRNA (guanine37-N1)-methyltransferase